MSESSLRVIMLSSLVHPYFELDSEKDIMRKKLNKLNDFDLFFPVPSILE